MLQITDLSVSAGGSVILSDVDLEVKEGEILGLLGPSGSGKSTLLRAVAGLTEVISGDIRWDGESILDVPTHLRGFGLMFQGYALFPHLDVAGNVGFGLKMRDAAVDDRQVEAALQAVGLAGFGERDVDSLSGGERQRVALARTLAPNPRLVMLDEPLGALDRHLRRELLEETREILEARDVTAIVVTHDRDEAVAFSDRIALMREGTILQSGTLDDLLDGPIDPWVAEFLG